MIYIINIDPLGENCREDPLGENPTRQKPHSAETADIYNTVTPTNTDLNNKKVVLVKDRRKVDRRAQPYIPAFPESFELSKMYREFEIHRMEKNARLTETTVAEQVKWLRTYPTETAMAMIYQSILRGWTGIFELKADTFKSKAERQEDISKFLMQTL